MCGPKWLIDELYSHNAVIHHSYTLEDNIIHHSYFSSFIFLFLRIVQIGSHNAVIHHSYTQNWNDELPHYDYHHSYTQNWVCGPNWYNHTQAVCRQNPRKEEVVVYSEVCGQKGSIE